MRQMGAERLGSVPLGTNGDNIKGFQTVMPLAPIAKFIITLSFSLLSSAAAFLLVMTTGASGAAEGVDDCDVLLNALFPLWAMFWNSSQSIGLLTPAQWRSVLGILNLRDFEGSFANGVQVPVSTGSAKALTIVVMFPVSLDLYFPDGSIFTQGGAHLMDGQFNFKTGASLTPSVVLTNGTAVVSGLGVDVKVQIGKGSAGDIGPLWRVERKTSLNLPFLFDDTERLFLADTTPAGSYAGSAISFMDVVNMDAAYFQSKYQAERLTVGGYDITQRVLPYMFRSDKFRFEDFAAHYGRELRLDVASGITTTNVYDCKVIAPSEGATVKVGTAIGHGGAVSTARVAPPSVGENGVVAEYLHHLLPLRVLPGEIDSGSLTPHASPRQAAAGVAKSKAAGHAVKARSSLFSRR